MPLGMILAGFDLMSLPAVPRMNRDADRATAIDHSSTDIVIAHAAASETATDATDATIAEIENGQPHACRKSKNRWHPSEQITT